MLNDEGLKEIIREEDDEASQDLGALDRLFKDIEGYRDTRNFKELLEFIRRFPKFAPFNAFLLHLQKPGSQYAASVSEWHQMGRTIKPGARPLVILWPFAPVHFVYELGDTEGDKPVPEDVLNPFKNRGEVDATRFSLLKQNLPCLGVTCHEADQGTGSAGSIQCSMVPKVQDHGGQKVWIRHNLILNKNHSRSVQYATMAHELGHLFCGHLGNNGQSLWQDRSRLPPEAEEFEAECVAWLVCERAGIENPSARYLAGYFDENGKIPDISVETVLKAVREIEAMTQKVLRPKKGVMAEPS